MHTTYMYTVGPGVYQPTVETQMQKMGGKSVGCRITPTHSNPSTLLIGQERRHEFISYF